MVHGYSFSRVFYSKSIKNLGFFVDGAREVKFFELYLYSSPVHFERRIDLKRFFRMHFETLKY
jgi:hypothetical protein